MLISTVSGIYNVSVDNGCWLSTVYGRLPSTLHVRVRQADEYICYTNVEKINVYWVCRARHCIVCADSPLRQAPWKIFAYVFVGVDFFLFVVFGDLLIYIMSTAEYDFDDKLILNLSIK